MQNIVKVNSIIIGLALILMSSIGICLSWTNPSTVMMKPSIERVATLNTDTNNTDAGLVNRESFNAD